MSRFADNSERIRVTQAHNATPAMQTKISSCTRPFTPERFARDSFLDARRSPYRLGFQGVSVGIPFTRGYPNDPRGFVWSRYPEGKLGPRGFASSPHPPNARA